MKSVHPAKIREIIAAFFTKQWFQTPGCSGIGSPAGPRVNASVRGKIELYFTLPTVVLRAAQADDHGPNYAQMVTDLRSLGALLGALEAAVAGLARGTPGGAPQHGPRHLRTGAALPLISFAGRAVTACYRSA